MIDPDAIRLSLQPKQIELGKLIEARGPNVAVKLGFGGARGGAKSGGARRLMLARRLKHDNTPGFIIRKNFPDIYENYIIKYQQEQPWMSDCFNAKHNEYTLHNGSRIAYKYADTFKDVERISRGPEAVDILIDQAEQFTEDELIMLMTPNRWPNSEPGFCKTWLFFNPGGPGTEYLRRIFHLKRYKNDEQAQDYSFIQAYGWDNYEWFRGQVDLTPRQFYELPNEERFQIFITRTDYGKKLNALPPSLRLGELLGSFEHFSDQYFAGVWDENVCTITPDLAKSLIQSWWTRWMAQDWGFQDHTAHGWFASGKLSPSDALKFLGITTQWPIEIVVLYRELVINERAEADLAMDIVNATDPFERRYVERFYLSVDAFGQKARQFGANSVGEQYMKIMQRYGLPNPSPADQRRVDGWRFMFNCLRQAHMRGREVTEEETKQGPMLLVSNECPAVIEAIPLALRDKDDKREDVIRVAGALWEDCCDLVRYGLISELDAQEIAPVEVRRREVYDAYEAPTPEQRTPEQMTSLSLAMRRFDAAENSRYKRVRRR